MCTYVYFNQNSSLGNFQTLFIYTRARNLVQFNFVIVDKLCREQLLVIVLLILLLVCVPSNGRLGAFPPRNSTVTNTCLQHLR